MNKSRALYYITRIDQPKNHHHCWQVRVLLKTGYVSKSFTDIKEGGRTPALKSAKRWRDLQVKSRGAFRPYQKRLDMGPRTTMAGQVFPIIGVTVQWNERPGGWYQYYNATAVVPITKIRIRKSFSVFEYGEKEAFILACRWRHEKSGKLYIRKGGGKLPCKIPVYHEYF